MSELKFDEYWFVLLQRNPEYDRSDEEKTKNLMTQHFEFIDDQINKGNLFVAIPFESGGLYVFDGSLEKDYMSDLLGNEGSITGGIFVADLKRAFVPEHHVFFTLESKKQINRFHQLRRKSQN